MADWGFARATSWEEVERIHDQWVTDYNAQSHLAHQQRQDDRRSPAEVLAWVRGQPIEDEELDRVFRHTRARRRVDGLGYVRFRHWRLYSERGLGGERVAVWLSADRLTLAYQDEPLAEYQVRYQSDGKRLALVNEPRLFATPYRSLQPRLWEWRTDEWLRVIRQPLYQPPRQSAVAAAQGQLFI